MNQAKPITQIATRYWALYPIFLLTLFLAARNAGAQSSYTFQPLFNARECDDIFKLNFAFLDTLPTHTFSGFLDGYTMHHRSPALGLDNAGDIWIRKDSSVVIMLRGTTGKMQSILADFYCAMMPAKGVVTLRENERFEYQLADDPRAAVHAGFLAGFAYLAVHMQPQIDHLYHKGYRRFIVGGHSQGGALAYYFSAWLMQQRKKGIYNSILVKTYASASPKMGNMYFAYDYDNAQLSQWSFSVVNTSDPVPEMPFTTQQIDIDMNEPNPILNLVKRFDDLPFLKRMFLKNAFRKMERKSRKSSEAYQRYLGKQVGNFIHQSLPDLQLPAPVKTTYFVRPGVPIILSANEAYRQYYQNAPNYFHHGVDPYRFLLREYYKGLGDFVPVIAE